MKIKIIFLTITLLAATFYFTLDNSQKARSLLSKFINPHSALKPIERNRIVADTETWDDPRGLFPIFAFNLPDSAKDLTESLRIIERSGINIIINGNYSWMPEPYKVKEAFTKLGRSNLRWLVILENECKDDFIYCNSNDSTNNDIIKHLKNFNEPFVYGFYIWDEPGRNYQFCTPFNLKPNNDFEDINRMASQLRSSSEFKDKLDFVNLFPTYWEGTKTFNDYEKYVDAFINSMTYRPRVICFDHYPYLKKEFGGFRKDFYANLEIFRNKSNQYQIPFWMIILSSEHLDYKKLSFEEISFQAYSALAYGAKGIGYYIFSKSWEHYGYRSWILEKNFDNSSLPDSSYGEFFPLVKQLNSRIQAIGKFLLDKECSEVIHLSNEPNNQQMILPKYLSKDSLIIIDKSTSDKDIFFGLFSNKQIKDKIYVLFVNKDTISKKKIKFKLSKEAEIKKFNPDEEKFFSLKKGTEFSLEINPSFGDLYEINLVEHK
jgi:hypothetical protein